jgi:hypothetical protein
MLVLSVHRSMYITLKSIAVLPSSDAVRIATNNSLSHAPAPHPLRFGRVTPGFSADETPHRDGRAA